MDKREKRRTLTKPPIDMTENKYCLNGKYMNGDDYFERLTAPEAASTIDWIFRTDNKMHPFGTASTVIDYTTLTVEIDQH